MLFGRARSLLFRHELRAEDGAGIKRKSENGANPEIPFAKELAIVLPKSIDGRMYFRETYTAPDKTTLTHPGT
jgi:hypothetical protein